MVRREYVFEISFSPQILLDSSRIPMKWRRIMIKAAQYDGEKSKYGVAAIATHLPTLNPAYFDVIDVRKNMLFGIVVRLEMLVVECSRVCNAHSIYIA